MKINRDHFLATALMISAVNATACKTKAGDEATAEGNQAEGIGPTQEAGLGSPKYTGPAKEGINIGKIRPLKGPSAEGPAAEGPLPAPAAEAPLPAPAAETAAVPKPAPKPTANKPATTPTPKPAVTSPAKK